MERKRSRVRKVSLPPCPAILDGPGSDGAAEIADATAYYAADPPPRRAFPHRVYKDDSVKHSLNDAFQYKCAYCESSYGETQPVDVEHYRPKGAIDTAARGTIKPGYFWLAATWANLLPACIDCNRRRRHTGRDGVPVTLGKGNQFPLAREEDRVTTPGANVAAEAPLLLNPYADEPDRHLQFLESGPVRPAHDPAAPDSEDRKGRATIDTAALNRPRLVRAREAYARRVKIQLARVADAEQNIRTYGVDRHLLSQLRGELDQLAELMDHESPYLTMTAQLIATRR